MKSFFLTLSSLLIIFIILGIACTKLAQADSISGWVWSGTQDSEGNSTGFGWGSLSGSNYNLDVPLINGNVTGYIWSENLGWINFNPSGPYPSGPNYSVQRSGNQLVGWAQITSINTAAAIGNSGGWQGWIKMTGNTQTGSPYGVDLTKINNGTNDTVGDYAWSEELGWISFEKVTPPPNPQLVVCPENDADDLKLSIRELADNKIDLGSYYAESFSQLNCPNKSQSWVSQVDSPSTWTSSDNSILNVNSEGLVSAVSSATKDSTAEIKVSYKGLEDSLNICVYDCSSCVIDTYNNQTCDGGCGVDCTGVVSRGEHWMED